MRIFSKVALRFDHPAGQEPAVVVRPQDFADVPDWVADSAMYKLASGDETVTEIETRNDERKADKKAASESNVKPPSNKAKAAEGTDLAGTAGN